MGCTLIPALLFLVVACLAVVLLAPGRTNVLLLGVDYTRGESFAGRTDTLILATIQPQRPYVGLLSIPRDLWVDIPGFGQNRINTAHFFAESAIPGSGATAAMATVEANFGVSVDRYVRIRFDGFREVVDALGGVDIELTEAQAGYEAGTHHLTGNKALAFVRSRIGSDDFFRMARGQMMLRAILKDLARPKNWVRLPAVLAAVNGAIDTNLSPLQLARLGFTALRLGPSKIDSRTLDRTMALGYVTSDGADVLLPQWEAINPLLKEMFGQ